jgi:hypothetical protein
MYIHSSNFRLLFSRKKLCENFDIFTKSSGRPGAIATFALKAELEKDQKKVRRPNPKGFRVSDFGTVFAKRAKNAVRRRQNSLTS